MLYQINCPGQNNGRKEKTAMDINVTANATCTHIMNNMNNNILCMQYQYNLYTVQ